MYRKALLKLFRPRYCMMVLAMRGFRALGLGLGFRLFWFQTVETTSRTRAATAPVLLLPTTSASAASATATRTDQPASPRTNGLPGSGLAHPKP